MKKRKCPKGEKTSSNQSVLYPKRGLTKRAPDAGILRKSQAVSYALAFFWLDGFAVPAPAQVTQSVSPLPWKYKKWEITSAS